MHLAMFVHIVIFDVYCVQIHCYFIICNTPPPSPAEVLEMGRIYRAVYFTHTTISSRLICLVVSTMPCVLYSRYLSLIMTGKLLGKTAFYWLSFLFLPRSEEHTSELQSHSDLVCRLLLEKKKKKKKNHKKKNLKKKISKKSQNMQTGHRD